MEHNSEIIYYYYAHTACQECTLAHNQDTYDDQTRTQKKMHYFM